jgi:hypothetical protein
VQAELRIGGDGYAAKRYRGCRASSYSAAGAGSTRGTTSALRDLWRSFLAVAQHAAQRAATARPAGASDAAGCAAARRSAWACSVRAPAAEQRRPPAR